MAIRRPASNTPLDVRNKIFGFIHPVVRSDLARRGSNYVLQEARVVSTKPTSIQPNRLVASDTPRKGHHPGRVFVPHSEDLSGSGMNSPRHTLRRIRFNCSSRIGRHLSVLRVGREQPFWSSPAQGNSTFHGAPPAFTPIPRLIQVGQQPHFARVFSSKKHSSALSKKKKAKASTNKSSKMAPAAAIQSQRVDAPLTAHATFLVLTIADGADIGAVRSTLASMSDLAKNVAIRDPTSNFAVTAGIGAGSWDAVTGKAPRPRELHPFKEVKGKTHTAPSTPGDLLFHIRAERRDLCFEFERQLLDSFGTNVAVEDVTSGFRYFDLRDLLGFVDGTANPAEPDDVIEATVITAADEKGDDAATATVSTGGSYVVIQKYLHNLAGWRALKAEQQESIIGRTKLDNEELEDAAADAQKAHKTLATIEDEETGEEFEILRDNMPFGSPGKGEIGTYFIGYARRLWVVEKMLERMFIGVPEGLHDRILDFSTAKSGCVFFVPPAAFLAGLEDVSG